MSRHPNESSIPLTAWVPSGRLCAALTALAVGFGLSSGCVCPPPAKVEAQHGVVRAGNEAQARTVAVALDEMYGRVRQILPHTRDVRVDCWVQERPQLFVLFPASDEVGGFAVRALDRIHLRDEPRRLRSYLAHELVHLLLDDSWNELPPALEEGLAEHVSFQLEPDPYHNDRPEKLLHALSVAGKDFWELCELRLARPSSIGGVKVVFETIDPEDPVVEHLRVFDSDRSKVAAFFSHDDTPVWYSLGFLAVSRLVDRHGYDGLHSLCRKAEGARGDEGRVAVFTEAAGLTMDPATWREACLEELREDDLQWYAEVTADQWACLTAKVSRPVYPDMDGRAFLEQARPVLGVQGAPLEVPLHDIPAFRGKLLEEWPAPAGPSGVTAAPP